MGRPFVCRSATSSCELPPCPGGRLAERQLTLDVRCYRSTELNLCVNALHNNSTIIWSLRTLTLSKYEEFLRTTEILLIKYLALTVFTAPSVVFVDKLIRLLLIFQNVGRRMPNTFYRINFIYRLAFT